MMKTKLIIIVLLLVVIPTAALSLMAGRFLRNREMVLRGQLELRADQSLQSVSDQVMALLKDTLEYTRSSIELEMSRGGTYSKIAKTENELVTSRSIVSKVYLFLSPWGFLYPQDKVNPDGLRPGWDFIPDKYNGELDVLVNKLRKEISAEASLFNITSFVSDNEFYMFKPLWEKKAFYVGYHINTKELYRYIQQIADNISGSGLVINIEGQIQKKDPDIVVSDSISSGIPDMREKGSEELKPFTSMTMPAPFNNIRIIARSSDPDAISRGAHIDAQLYGWSIVLMVAGIVAGLGILLREAAMEIKHARAKTDFVVGVSHDLRTPVSSMKILSESLYNGHVVDPDKQKQFLGTIVRECNRLADMIEHVLFFIRQEHGAPHYSFEEMDFGLIVQSVVKTFRDRIHENLEIVVDIEKNMPLLELDGDAISKVVFNLIDNAWKYSTIAPVSTSENSHITKRIFVKAGVIVKKGRKYISLDVQDSGIGIENRELKKIFKKFYRVAIEKEGTVGGIGLGLSICQTIIKAHKGEITVESQVGNGSTFSVLLPVMRRVVK